MTLTDTSRAAGEGGSGQRVAVVSSGDRSRTASPREGRTLLSYLIVPRPGDVVKAVLMPLIFGLGVLAAGGASRETVWRALLALVVLELLVYPARYQWNDIRGFAADQRHPARAERGRLPGPPQMARERVLASTLVAAARIGAAAVIAVLPGLRLGGVVVAVVLGVFGVAFAYEALRSAATGRDNSATPRVTPAVGALWLTVGAGYVVRGMTGLAMAVDLRERPGLALSAVVTLWAYGIAFVMSRWAVESLAFAGRNGNRVIWSASASHAREHLLALTRWLPGALPPGGTVPGWAALRGRTPVIAPWNLALILAAGGSAVTGLLLTTPVHDPRLPLTYALIGGFAALSATLASRVRAVIALLGVVALLAAGLAGPVSSPIVACLPLVAVLAAYLHFSSQSLNSLGRPRRSVREPLARVLEPAARLAVGRDTWRLLTPRGTARG
jgi:hypothetical protein